MTRIVNGRGAVTPDGRCHAAITTVLLHGCDNPVPEGRWTCDAHAVALWQHAQDLIVVAQQGKRR